MRSYCDGKKVLVAGGTGFIDSNLVESLLQNGTHVKADNLSREHLENLSGLLNKCLLREGLRRTYERVRGKLYVGK